MKNKYKIIDGYPRILGKVYKFDLSTVLYDKIPECVRKVLNLNGGFKSYIINPNNDRDKNRYYNSNVQFNNDGSDTLSCDGVIEYCIKGIADILRRDNGFIGGKTFYINDDDLSTLTNEEFTGFCYWLNKWLTNWIDGIKHNVKMRHYFLSSLIIKAKTKFNLN